MPSPCTKVYVIVTDFGILLRSSRIRRRRRRIYYARICIVSRFIFTRIYIYICYIVYGSTGHGAACTSAPVQVHILSVPLYIRRIPVRRLLRGSAQNLVFRCALEYRVFCTAVIKSNRNRRPSSRFSKNYCCDPLPVNRDHQRHI